MEAEQGEELVLMPKWSAYQGVTAFIGMPGSGKTYSLVATGCERLQEGRTVWANFCIVPDTEWSGTFHQFRDIEELIVVPEGVVVLLDEAQNMFNARSWQEFPPGFLYRLSQVRKDGLEFYWSSQAEEFVDANLRRLTANVWFCRAVTKRLFRRSLFGPMELRKADEKPRRREFRKVRLDVAGHYDTLEKVAIRRSWLIKVLELADDPFIDVPKGATMQEVLEIARRARDDAPLALRGRGRQPRIGVLSKPAIEAESRGGPRREAVGSLDTAAARVMEDLQDLRSEAPESPVAGSRTTPV